MARVALTDDNGALYGAPATWLNDRFALKGETGNMTALADQTGRRLYATYSGTQREGVPGAAVSDLALTYDPSLLATSLGSVTLDPATDRVTTPAPHGLQVGDRIRFTTGSSLPSGVYMGGDYYVRSIQDTTTFDIQNNAGFKTTWSEAGTGNLYKWPLKTEWAALRDEGGIPNPRFRFVDGKPIQAGTTHPTRDWIKSDPSVLTYAPGSYQGPQVSAEIAVTSKSFDFLVAYYLGSATKVYVDGRLLRTFLPEEFANLGFNPGNMGRINVEFQSAVPRVVRIEVGNGYICGVECPDEDPPAYPPVAAGARTMIQGDSFTAKYNLAPAEMGYGEWVQKLIGWGDVWRCGSSSTGYVKDGARLALIDRWQNDIVAQNPDRLILAMGINDTGTVATEVAAAAATIIDGTLDALPHIEIVVLGPWANRSPEFVNANHVEIDTELQKVAEDRGLRFISPMQELWITGNGYVGAENGSGNADIYISSDGLHPTAAGHEYLGRRLAGHLAL